MPLYEYECTQCHRRLEKIQKFSDPELTVCPHCGGSLERTITAPAIQFKGAGWYKDLYSSAKPPSAPGGEAAGTTGGGEGSAAPSKPEGTSAGATPAAASAPSTGSGSAGSGSPTGSGSSGSGSSAGSGA